MFDAWWLQPGERLPSAVSWSAETLPPLAIMGAAMTTDTMMITDLRLARRGVGGLMPWSLTCPSLHASTLGSALPLYVKKRA